MNITKLFALLMVAMLSLTACNEQGPMEKAGEAIDDAATDAGNAVEDACEDVKDAANAEDTDC